MFACWSYLQRLEITQADQVLFIADGCRWMWKRVPLLVQALSLVVEQVHELLDFYDGVQHLGQVAALGAKTGVRKLVFAGAPNSVASCCKARWSRSLRPQAIWSSAATARRSARSGTTSSRTRAAWRMPSSSP